VVVPSPRQPAGSAGGSPADRLSAGRIADAPLGVLAGKLPVPKLIRLERHLGPQTLGSLANLLPVLEMAPALLRPPAVGRMTLAEVRTALQDLARNRLAPAEDVAAVREAAWDALQDERHTVAHAVMLAGRPLPELAAERGGASTEN
jgi:hypothetical protein